MKRKLPLIYSNTANDALVPDKPLVPPAFSYGVSNIQVLKSNPFLSTLASDTESDPDEERCDNRVNTTKPVHSNHETEPVTKISTTKLEVVPISLDYVKSHEGIQISTNSKDIETEEDSSGVNDTCFICGIKLSTLPHYTARDIHVRNCLSKSRNNDNSFGLLEKSFYCVICDKKLDATCILNRCKHLKKCAKDHHVSTKLLLELVGACMDDNTIEENNRIDNEDEEGVILDKCQSRFTTTSSSSSSSSLSIGRGQKEVIVIDDEEEEEEVLGGGFGMLMETNNTNSATTANNTDNQSTNAAGSVSIVSAVGVTVKNAFTHLMSSAKMMMKPSAPKQSKTTTPTSTAVTTSSSSSASTSLLNNDEKQAYVYNCPAYKKVIIPGKDSHSTSHNIIVDGFQYASNTLSNCYFLTHFHSDHYMGLSSSFAYGMCIYLLNIKMQNTDN